MEITAIFLETGKPYPRRERTAEERKGGQVDPTLFVIATECNVDQCDLEKLEKKPAPKL